MLCFDKLKIVTTTQYIQNIDGNSFIAHTKNKELLYYKYQQRSPYSLLIMIDYRKDELSIEFTSKILMEKCTELINQNNIKVCLQNINALQICQLDIDSILNDSNVVKCDVTKDVLCSDIKSITKQIYCHLANCKKWVCEPYEEGVVLRNMVSTPRHKNRIVIYDKGREMGKAINVMFLSKLKNREEVMQYFQGKVRFEANINTMVQIREMLKINDNSLMSVLQAQTSPFIPILSKALNHTQMAKNIKSNTLMDYQRELLLRECEYDMHKVELKIRSLISKNTSIKRILKPYKRLWEEHLKDESIQEINIWELVA